jgi:hypothetical protein
MIVAGNPNVPGRPNAPLIITAATSVPGPDTVYCVIKGSPTLSRSGGTSASASSGQGGWQITDRTRRKASTEWLDYYPFVQTMTAMVDGGTGLNPSDVEAQCTFLESLEAPVPGQNPALPPIVTIAGPVHHTDFFWVVTRLSFDGGDAGQIRNAAGLRTQQHFTIEFTEYSPTAAIVQPLTLAQALPILAGNTSGQGIIIPSGKTYTVVAGDTLQSIAARVLSNVNDWIELALLNGLSNSALLTPGKILQLPTP